MRSDKSKRAVNLQDPTLPGPWQCYVMLCDATSTAGSRVGLGDTAATACEALPGVASPCAALCCAVLRLLPCRPGLALRHCHKKRPRLLLLLLLPARLPSRGEAIA
jgi:hypothetical protein